MRRRTGLAAVLALAAAAAAVARRRTAASRERVDLYHADGSLTTLEPGSPGAARLLALAREGLAAARGS